MMKFILGKKQGMSQMFDKEGNVVPVTIIEAGPCFVTQIKTKEKDGYSSIQIGLGSLKEKKIKISQKKKPYSHIKEFLLKEEDLSKYNIGDKIDVSIFTEGDKVKATGTSKGRGFQGVVKRHGFKGGPASHGHKDVLRRAGSIGRSFPERVVKGMRMAGHMGVDRVSVKNLKVAAVDLENNLIALKGAIPGSNSGLIEISC